MISRCLHGKAIWADENCSVCGGPFGCAVPVGQTVLQFYRNQVVRMKALAGRLGNGKPDGITWDEVALCAEIEHNLADAADEIKRLTAALDHAVNQSVHWQAERDRLRAALIKYSRHLPDCRLHEHAPSVFTCSCGRDKTMWEVLVGEPK